MKFWRSCFFGLVYALPAVLFFSYYPLISLGRDATMNFELSLPLIWLVLFFLVSFINLVLLGKAASAKRLHSSSKSSKTKFGFNFPGISDRRFFLFALFPLYVTVSIFWSANPTRAILTTGVLWLVFLAVFALLFITPLLQPAANFRRNLLKVFFASTALICLFCWVQCLLDVLSVPREGTLLCLGCTHRTFGFPHPSGFAIEPQFMGNLLLAPTLTGLYLLVFRPARARATRTRTAVEQRTLFALVMFFSATLFLTLSRGAIYAYGVALVVLTGFALYNRFAKHRHDRARRTHYAITQWQNLLIIPATTFVIALFMQGVFSAVSPTASTFTGGIAKVVHQLSLGIIDLRSLATSPAQADESATDQFATGQPAPTTGDATESSTASNAPAFDGYVAASTNVRLGLSGVALQTYGLTPLRMLFGVGIGGAGVAMSAAFPEHPLITPDNIVQNEFISLLLEVGIVGWALLLVGIFLAFRPKSEFWHHPALPLLVTLIIAYLITLNFFSGFANALQIYLLPPLLYYCFQEKSKNLEKSACISAKTVVK